MKLRWQPLLGIFDESEGAIWFRGGSMEAYGQASPAIGNLLCDQRFAGGTISAKIEFTDVAAPAACELILYYDPARKYMVTAGLGSGPMFAVRHWDENGWQTHGYAGHRENLRSGNPYHVTATLKGSWVRLTVDGVDVTSANLPFALPPSQVGVWCGGFKDIAVRNFKIDLVRGRAFVVMQFGSPYDQLYSEVIAAVCKEFELDAVRADESFGPGLIIADIVRDIQESKLVIAEISPSNPNVYYEVGYAHAINKPTILVAKKGNHAAFRSRRIPNSLLRGLYRWEEPLRGRTAKTR
ncbi:MAG: hypothetical protein HY914_14895 [Desulfomonile tiedjei]|nr:hypothetical protein [Desulfomonile tiedjei]